MPSYISIGGKWVPANEYAVNPNAQPGEKATYEGPDRAATEELKKEGVEFLGSDIRKNQELRQLARSFGYSGKDAVEKYLEEMHDKKYEDLVSMSEKELKSFVNTHTAGTKKQKRKKSTKQPSGGDDTSGSGKHRKGGFDEPTDVVLPK